MKFKDIPKFTSRGSYRVNIDLSGIECNISRYTKRYDLLLNPDFQRGHVWTEEQQTKFLEFLLSGGYSGKDIYFNCPGWMEDSKQMVLIDGLQRVTAALKFVDNKIHVYGALYKEYNRIPDDVGFIFHINNLSTRIEELNWYIQLNEGGIVHSKTEIERVRQLVIIEQEKEDVNSNSKS